MLDTRYLVESIIPAINYQHKSIDIEEIHLWNGRPVKGHKLIITIHENIQIIVTAKRNEHYLELEIIVVYPDVVAFKLEIKKVPVFTNTYAECHYPIDKLPIGQLLHEIDIAHRTAYLKICNNIEYYKSLLNRDLIAERKQFLGW